MKTLLVTIIFSLLALNAFSQKDSKDSFVPYKSLGDIKKDAKFTHFASNETCGVFEGKEKVKDTVIIAIAFDMNAMLNPENRNFLCNNKCFWEKQLAKIREYVKNFEDNVSDTDVKIKFIYFFCIKSNSLTINEIAKTGKITGLDALDSEIKNRGERIIGILQSELEK